MNYNKLEYRHNEIESDILLLKAKQNILQSKLVLDKCNTALVYKVRKVESKILKLKSKQLLIQSKMILNY